MIVHSEPESGALVRGNNRGVIVASTQESVLFWPCWGRTLDARQLRPGRQISNLIVCDGNRDSDPSG